MFYISLGSDIIILLVMNYLVFAEDCPVDFSKKGCFNDLQAGSRPLPQLMFTDLDKSSTEYSGLPVDWGNWDAYLDDVVCRCAQVSKAKGFNLFGIGNFGEYNAYCFLRGLQ